MSEGLTTGILRPPVLRRLGLLRTQALLVSVPGNYQTLTPPARPTMFMLNSVLFSLEGHQDESP